MGGRKGGWEAAGKIGRGSRARTAVLLTTRKRAPPSTEGATDHRPPSEEFTTTLSKVAGRPRTREAGSGRPFPARSRHRSQNLFFLRRAGGGVRRAERHRPAPGALRGLHVPTALDKGVVALGAAIALDDAAPAVQLPLMPATVPPLHRHARGHQQKVSESPSGDSRARQHAEDPAPHESW